MDCSEEKFNLLRRVFESMFRILSTRSVTKHDWSENLLKWIRNIFEIMSGHLERKRFVSCFIESGKVFINQNAGKFLISEEYDQEGFRAALNVQKLVFI